MKITIFVLKEHFCSLLLCKRVSFVNYGALCLNVGFYQFDLIKKTSLLLPKRVKLSM